MSAVCGYSYCNTKGSKLPNFLLRYHPQHNINNNQNNSDEY
jgi:hypothetical protein